MRSIAVLGALALFAAAPLSAQGKFRTGEIGKDTRGQPAPTTTTTQKRGQLPGGVLDQGRETQGRKSSHIPPGQMPPAGMCRVWIDGVPPGQQPAPTDCQTAVATSPANARVIFGGEGTSFPGKGKGKFDKSKQDRHDDNDIEDRARRGGVLGSVIPSRTQQPVAAAKAMGKSNGKGKGRG